MNSIVKAILEALLPIALKLITSLIDRYFPQGSLESKEAYHDLSQYVGKLARSTGSKGLLKLQRRKVIQWTNM